MKPQDAFAKTLYTLLTVVALALLLGLVALALCFAAGSSIQGADSLSFASPLPTPAASPSPTLAEPTLDPTQAAGINLVATKEAGVVFARQTTEAARLITPDPTQLFLKLHPTPMQWPTPDLADSSYVLEGIPAGMGRVTKMIPPFYTHEYGVINTWYEVTDEGTSVTYVHAGFVSQPTGETTFQGLVTGQVLRKDAGTGDFELVFQSKYPTPSRTGPVEVIDAVGERVALRSTEGSIFYFDVPTRQFAPSLTVTITALPPTVHPDAVTPTETARP